MKVEVLAEQLVYTDSNNVRRDYVRGQVLEMADEHAKAILAEEAKPVVRWKDGSQQEFEQEKSIRPVVAEARVSEPVKTQAIKPAPQPKPAGADKD